MTSFDQRENAFEAEFAHREELRFKVGERAVRLLALWAAERLARRPTAARSMPATSLRLMSSTPEPLLERVATDLDKKGVSEEEVNGTMDRFLIEAVVAIGGSTSAS
jgi:hypothetical protein